MRKRFVLVIDSSTAISDKKIVEWARDKGFGWWHWIDNIWLLHTHNTSISAASIYGEISQFDNRSKLVFEVTGIGGWCGHGPKAVDRDDGEPIDKQNMFTWLKTYW